MGAGGAIVQIGPLAFFLFWRIAASGEERRRYLLGVEFTRNAEGEEPVASGTVW